MAEGEEVALGIGSNEGDARRYCEEAVHLLLEGAVVREVVVSSWYRTEPQGYREQAWFVNGVLWGYTHLAPRALLLATQTVEEKLGRVRQTRWGPRTADIDILFYGQKGQRCVDEEDLVIPHPLLQERRFVLIPLLEIVPGWIHPRYGKSLREMVRTVPVRGQMVKRIHDR